MEKILTLKNVSKTFDNSNGKGLKVLDDIDLSINEGEFFVFLGPSGSGKSTLLRIMSRLEKEHEGEVILGKNLSRKDFSFVFQQFALLPWLTVYENVKLSIITKEIPEEEKDKTIKETLKKLGLEKFSDSYPRELSGGMKQRVGIARALVKKPKLIFMDEPFSELDSFTAEELKKDILEVWQEQKPTIIMVTHRIDEAIELADRIAVLTSRPGKIEALIKNTMKRPRNKRSKEFYKLEDYLYKVVKPEDLHI